MKVLAIDPGPTESAYVLWGGALEAFGKQPNQMVLYDVAKWYGQHSFHHCVIEKVCSYGMAVGEEIFETVYWSGRFAQAFGAEKVDRLRRLDVKLHLCHDSRAKDANIRAALIDRFGGPQSVRKGGALYKVSGDVWAALAVAVTWWDRHRDGGEAVDAVLRAAGEHHV